MPPETVRKHRKLPDGTMWEYDNWKGGIPIWRYIEGKARHFWDTWLNYEGQSELAENPDIEESLCAELFNTMGMLFEILNDFE